jgi:hypothetical protein
LQVQRTAILIGTFHQSDRKGAAHRNIKGCKKNPRLSSPPTLTLSGICNAALIFSRIGHHAGAAHQDIDRKILSI